MYSTDRTSITRQADDYKFYLGSRSNLNCPVSWGLYRLVLPKAAREWARAGLVQAFIIAFYAEMYGFPVTVYLLTRVFNLGVGSNFWDGNLWVYLTGTQWAMRASMTAVTRL
jgi:hypothetical protein